MPVGSPIGRIEDWIIYMNKYEGTQRRALDALLETAREIDYRYGTNVLTHDLWENLLRGNFRVFP